MGGRILDAGCGSGVVSRHLAKQFPKSEVVACDYSEIRVVQARELARGTPNLTFGVENVSKLSFETSNFDAIVCRYVVEHLAETDVKTALSEFYRCLRPNGTLNIIDIDGFLYNLYPQTELVDRVLKKVASERPFDLHIGRKLPKLIHDAQFVDVDWRVETLTFKGEKLEDEMVLLREKFSQGLPYFSQSLGSETIAKQFVQEYFECLGRKGAVLFYNKFIVQAKKPPLAISK